MTRIYQSNFGITTVFELGKNLPGDKPQAILAEDGKTRLMSFQELYYCTPCVPVDFPTIEIVLRHCRSGRLKVSITQMPGLYNQRFDVNTSNFQSNSGESKTVVIRAAFPHLGAGLVYYEPRRDGASACRDHSCIDIHTSINSSSSNYRGSHGHTTICMSHLQLLHCSPGSDI